MIYDALTIAKWYLFGTADPGSDYNTHVRATNSGAADMPDFSMLEYLTTGPGRYAYPSMFGAVSKFFSATSLTAREYTLGELVVALGLNDRRDGPTSDVDIVVSQYGTDIRSTDHALRSLIFGGGHYQIKDGPSLRFVVDAAGNKSIKNLEVIAIQDDFDFNSRTGAAIIVNTILEPIFDPYELGRGPLLLDFAGPGRTYSLITAQDFEALSIQDDVVSQSQRVLDTLGVASILSSESGWSLFGSLRTAEFLNHLKDGRHVVYGTGESDNLGVGSLAAVPLAANAHIEQHYFVGGPGDDDIRAGDEGDVLLGGTGADALLGGPGDDRLEGGAGIDVMDGQDGADTLDGGEGSDILDGGEGTDLLVGGEGIDEYHFGPNWGADRVRDEDGHGSLAVNGYPDGLPTGILVRPDFWQDASRQVSYSRVPGEGGNYNLVVQFSGVNAANTIVIENWSQDRSLGIELVDATPTAVTAVLYGDFETTSVFIDPSSYPAFEYFYGQKNYVSGGPKPNKSDVLFAASLQPSIVYGLGGTDLLRGSDDQSDTLDGGEGDDLIWGSMGSDTLIGGPGNDSIFSRPDGSPTDIFFWRPGDPPLDPGTAEEFARFWSGIDRIEWYQFWMTHFSPVVNSGRATDVNVLDGGSGDDWLFGNRSVDNIFGGDGEDLAQGGAGSDAIQGGSGNDTLSGDNYPERIFYSADQALNYVPAVEHGNDFIDGGDGNDLISGDGGADKLFGGAGTDRIFGDAELDPSVKGSQSIVQADPEYHRGDYLDGGDGDDLLVGGGGNDSLFGGNGADTLDGDDILSEWKLSFEWHGQDFLDGGVGNDRLIGGAREDTILGGDGDDDIFGDSGATQSDDLQSDGDDVIDGGNGQDRIAAQGGNDHVEAGPGNDTVFGGSGSDWIYGGAGNDFLSGGDSTSTSQVSSKTGDDSIYGGDGDDVLIGAAGADILIGGAGLDYIDGGLGDDVIHAELLTINGLSETVVAKRGQGSDTLILSGIGSAGLQVQAFGSDVQLSDHQGNSLIILDGLNSSIASFGLGAVTPDGYALMQTRASRFYGENLQSMVIASSIGSGAALYGGRQGDTLTVPAGQQNVLVSGGNGNDLITLASISGATIEMSKGDGLDSVSAAARADASAKNVLRLDTGISSADVRIVWRDDGRHVLSIGSGDGVAFNLTGYANAAAVPAGAWPIDEVRYSNGSIDSMSAIVARGVYTMPVATTADDYLPLTPLNDTFDALAGDDEIDGGAGDDVLFGGLGNDKLLGGAGDDTLNGGAGSNQLEGGEGDDKYLIAASSNLAIDSTASNDTYSVTAWGGLPYASLSLQDFGGDDTLEILSPAPSASILVVNNGRDLVFSSNGGFDDGSRIFVQDAIGADGEIIPGRMIERVTFANGEVWGLPEIIARTLRTTDGSDQVTGYGGNDTIDGGAGHDTLRGAGGSDVLSGGSGFDTLDGGAGDDVLAAGADGGRLAGGGGHDRFLVTGTDGNVVIADLIGSGAQSADNDTLVIAAPRSTVSVTANIAPVWNESFTPDSLQLAWNGTSVTIELVGSLAGLTQSNKKIEFADQTVSLLQLLQPHLAAVGTSGADSIYGTSLDETLSGAAGNDYIHAGLGVDVLNGGNGDDQLTGRMGGDTFIGGVGNDTLMLDGTGNSVSFAAGDGRDLVVFTGRDMGGVLSLGSTLTPTAVSVDWQASAAGPEAVPSQFLVSFQGSQDTILVDTAQSAQGWVSAINGISFSNGTQWDLSQLLQTANASSSGPDRIFDATGVDSLAGGAGDDLLYGWFGDDTIDGGSGVDRLLGGGGDDVLRGGVGNDVLQGQEGLNTIRLAVGDGQDVAVTNWYSSAGTAWVEGGYRVALDSGIAPSAVMFMRGTSFHDYQLRIGSADAVLFQSTGGTTLTLPAEVAFADGSVWSRAQLADKLRQGSSGDDDLAGFHDTSDTIDGGQGNDTIRGGYGADTLRGGAGNDTLYGRGADRVPYDRSFLAIDGTDVLEGGTGDDVLYAGSGDVIYRFDAGFGKDTIAWTSERLQGTTATVEFGADITAANLSFSNSAGGAVTIRVGTGTDRILVEGFHDVARPVSQIRFADGSTMSYAQIVPMIGNFATEGADELTGTAGADVLDGLGGDDVLRGMEGNDHLIGGTGADQLFGDDGNDLLEGGDGNDTFYAGSGVDVVRGGAGNDIINLEGGADTVVAGLGDDTINATSDPETFDVAAGWGNDTIFWAVGGDKLRFDATVSANSLTLWRSGNGLLVEHAASSSSVLFQGFYGEWDATGLTFGFSNGTTWNLTTIQAAVSGVIGTNGDDTLTASASGGLMRGMAGNDTLNGSSGADTLDGGTGNDRLVGGTGNDIYIVDSASDIVTESSSTGGTDTVRSWLSWTLGTNLENLELLGSAAINATGNTLNNQLIGNAAANLLNGGTGADVMTGGDGDDTYVVDNAGDTTVESANQGVDTVQSGITWTLAANVERLVLTGTSAINGTGNALNNTLTGNAGANVLDGGVGNDTLIGGAGNDSYAVDATGDTVVEAAAGGTDAVSASISWSLPDNVENLTLTGTAALQATGNALANVLTGNAGDNQLDGGTGNDTLVGGAGNDTYLVDSTSDVVTEGASAGTDTIVSSVTLTLPANVENLTLAGSAALSATGNTLANVLRGNAAANTLNGGTGNDAMIGGVGDDTYVVDATGDTVTENANEGDDHVQAGVTYTLSANVERLTLTGTTAINGTGNAQNNILIGNSANNTLAGGAGDDLIDGGTGNDTMQGGAGNDTFVVNVATDVVTENANEGVDLVQSAVAWTLGANVENLTLTGTTAINGTGNALDNVLIGNSANNTLSGGAGNDTLDGGLGNDTMTGGAGNDIYVVNVATDVVTENANEGTDTIQSAVAWALGNNLENLVLTGAGAINGTGNTLANVLTGNAGANVLTGAAGNDTLDGGAGNDTLNGGVGADTYHFARGYGADTIQDNDSTSGVIDMVSFAFGIAKTDVVFTKVGNDLQAGITGTTDRLLIKDWYLGSANKVEQFRFTDGSVLTDAQVGALVQPANAGGAALVGIADAGDQAMFALMAA